MDLTLTLIVNPDTMSLDETIVTKARAALNGLGGESAPAHWLSEGEACEIGFEGLNPEQGEAAVRQALADAPIDVIAQDSANRKKKLLLADMDSTIVIGETLDELADYAGLKDKIAAITARAMNGELNFIEALKERVGMLKDLDAKFLDDTLARTELMPGAKTLVATMKANKAYTALVSGGFTFFTEAVSADVGFAFNRGNTLHVENGVLTGTVGEPIVDKDTKLETLKELSVKKKLGLADALTIGDGANDLPMLKAAGLGIAYRPKPAVGAEARARLDHANLVGALFAQGYSRDEFVG